MERIPMGAVALFMSDDENMRVNIIHGKVFLSVFMDMSTKKLVLQRIFGRS